MIMILQGFCTLIICVNYIMLHLPGCLRLFSKKGLGALVTGSENTLSSSNSASFISSYHICVSKNNISMTLDLVV